MCRTGGTAVKLGNADRLDNLHSELGVGEGVTALVRASLVHQRKGGDGVVLPHPDIENSTNESPGILSCSSQQCFQATLGFFEMISDCAQGIMQFPPKGRHSELRQRLETCNRYLFSQAAIAQVSVG